MLFDIVVMICQFKEIFIERAKKQFIKQRAYDQEKTTDNRLTYHFTIVYLLAVSFIFLQHMQNITQIF